MTLPALHATRAATTPPAIRYIRGRSRHRLRHWLRTTLAAAAEPATHCAQRSRQAPDLPPLPLRARGNRRSRPPLRTTLAAAAEPATRCAQRSRQPSHLPPAAHNARGSHRICHPLRTTRVPTSPQERLAHLLILVVFPPIPTLAGPFLLLPCHTSPSTTHPAHHLRCELRR